ncbi:MAG: NifU N-terminal domain-containing protein, partial [Rhodothermales bacterium]
TFIESGMESFNSRAEATGHPLAERLFEIDGVDNVFILPQFLTVTKSATADWNDVVPGVERVVEDVLDA